MQFSKWKIGAVALVCMLLPGSVHAQIVKNERLLSFEEKQVPAFCHYGSWFAVGH